MSPYNLKQTIHAVNPIFNRHKVLRGNQVRSSTNVPLVMMALVIASSAAVWAFLIERRITMDDYGLFNPIYMFVNYGMLTYPAHGYPDSMIVHPPLHYLVLGLLMKAGLPVHYAQSLPPLLLILIGIVLIVRGKFPDVIKMSLLFGLGAGSLLPHYVFSTSVDTGFGLGTMRPELHMALALFVGLTSLESGRLAGWNSARLLLGSFLLTYASAIHYVAAFSWTGVLIYLVWLLKVRGLKDRIKPIASLVIGVCVFAVPYFFLYLIPNLADIMAFVNSAEAIGGVVSSIGRHVRASQMMYAYLSREPLTAFLFYPLALGIPVVVLSSVVLFRLRATRGIALAGLPYELFLLFFVQRKEGAYGQAGYFYPELMLYLTGLAAFVMVTVDALFVGFLPRCRRLIRPTFFVILIGAIVVGTPWLMAAETSPLVRIDELSIARAAGRMMLGPDALVGARIGRSYIYGEASWYMIDPYVLWRNIDGLNLTDFFSKSDAIALDYNMSDQTVNELNESLSSWYANNILNIRGFYFSSRHNVALSYLLLSVRRPERIEGYCLLRNWQVMHFREQDDGDYTFAAVVCDINSLSNLQPVTLFQNRYLLPGRPGEGSKKEVFTFVSKTDDYLSFRSVILGRWLIRDEIRLRMESIDSHTLLATLVDDRPIQFYSKLEAAMDARSPNAGIFLDTFDTDAIGGKPSNWLVYEGSETEITIENLSRYGSAQKCVRISDNSPVNYCEMSSWRWFGKLSTVEFHIFPTQTNQSLNFYITSAYKIGVHFSLRDNGMLSYYDGSNWHDFAAYSADKWYNIRFEQFTSNAFDIYVDDVLMVRGARMRNTRTATTYGLLVFQTYPTHSGGIWYIGSVRVLWNR